MSMSGLLFAVFLGCVMEMASGQLPKCQNPRVCKNGGVCYIDNGGQEACFCRGPWVGQFCQNPDSCQPNPCQNSAICTITQNGKNYSCACLQGYGGRHCQNKLDPCSSQPCVRGLCQANGTTYVCRCPAGYTGKTCDQYVGLCHTKPCNTYDPEAQCDHDDPGYSCSCSNNHFGLNCEGTTTGCDEEEQSYCICAVNNLPVKFPFPQSEEYRGVRTSDVVDALIGLSVGYGLGALFWLIYHYCWYRPRPTPVRASRRIATPESTSTGASLSTGLSGRKTRVSAIDIQPSIASPANSNVYRAAFSDDTSYSVAARKSDTTYTSGDRDW